MKKLIFSALIHCLLLTVYSLPSYSAALLDRVVATVNDEVITWSELRRAIELEGIGSRRFGMTGEENEKKIEEIEKLFLNELIDIKLQLQEARELRLNVSDSETGEAINEIKKKYNLTDEALINSLKAEGFTLKEYRTRFAEQILLSKVVNFEVKPKIFISDKEIKEYYEVNKKKYSKGEKVGIRQIFFSAPADDSLKTAIEAKAEDMIKRIKNGEDFAKLAQEFSEDESKKFGGDLGYISRGAVLKELEDVAFALKTGEVSEPFWSPAGLHIIKLEDRTGGSSLEDVREDVKNVLFEKAFKIKYDEWIKKLREKAYIEKHL